jgi:GNAT superfamily N-acetyltransferase
MPQIQSPADTSTQELRDENGEILVQDEHQNDGMTLVNMTGEEPVGEKEEDNDNEDSEDEDNDEEKTESEGESDIEGESGNEDLMDHLFDSEDYDDDFEDPPISLLDCLATGLNRENHDVKLKVSMSAHYESDSAMNIWAECVEGGERIGSVRGLLLTPPIWELDFYEYMDPISGDCADLAINLFDQLGQLKEMWISDLETKGSGIWDHRLDYQCQFLVIEIADVKLAHRREGLGRCMVDALLKTAVSHGGAEYSFVWSTQLNSAEDAARDGDSDYLAKWDANKARADAFWRSMGFRRVGASKWLCRAMDENDPSHALAAEDDFDPELGKEPNSIDPDLLTVLLVEQDGLRDEEF